MHPHRNEEEHFVVLGGTCRILIEDKEIAARYGCVIVGPPISI
jgi:mannose-6-phosphate isomerase-like protein (cupin superfamily)